MLNGQGWPHHRPGAGWYGASAAAAAAFGGITPPGCPIPSSALQHPSVNATTTTSTTASSHSTHEKKSESLSFFLPFSRLSEREKTRKMLASLTITDPDYNSPGKRRVARRELYVCLFECRMGKKTAKTGDTDTHTRTDRIVWRSGK